MSLQWVRLKTVKRKASEKKSHTSGPNRKKISRLYFQNKVTSGISIARAYLIQDLDKVTLFFHNLLLNCIEATHSLTHLRNRRKVILQNQTKGFWIQGKTWSIHVNRISFQFLWIIQEHVQSPRPFSISIWANLNPKRKTCTQSAKAWIKVSSQATKRSFKLQEMISMSLLPNR